MSRFQLEARRALAEISGVGLGRCWSAGRVLYLRSVVDDLRLPGRWPSVAEQLESEADEPGGLEALTDGWCASTRGPRAGSRRPIGGGWSARLEVTVGSGRPFSSFGRGLEAYPPTRFTLIGLRFDPIVVDQRIAERFETWVRGGLLDEVRALAERPQGMSRTARQALGYRELLAHVEDGGPLSSASRTPCAPPGALPGVNGQGFVATRASGGCKTTRMPQRCWPLPLAPRSPAPRGPAPGARMLRPRQTAAMAAVRSGRPRRRSPRCA